MRPELLSGMQGTVYRKRSSCVCPLWIKCARTVEFDSLCFSLSLACAQQTDCFAKRIAATVGMFADVASQFCFGLDATHLWPCTTSCPCAKRWEIRGSLGKSVDPTYYSISLAYLELQDQGMPKWLRFSAASHRREIPQAHSFFSSAICNLGEAPRLQYVSIDRALRTQVVSCPTFLSIKLV